MSITREELYQAVWSIPTGKAAARYSVSGSFLARVCASLNVPRPPRGYWTKLKFGHAPPKSPLPPARPGDSLAWRIDGEAVPRIAPAPPTPADLPRRRVRVPDRHPLVWQVQSHFEKTRPALFSFEAHYLRPYKKKLPDVFVSKEQLPRALELANALYVSLTRLGHRVVLASDDGHLYTRPSLDHDGRRREAWSSSTWVPCVPTLAFIGTVAIGLTVYEPAEEVEARYVDGKVVRVSELPTMTRRSGYETSSKHSLPSRRLAVRAYSPYRGTTWEKTWAESGRGRLGTSVRGICAELAEAAPLISEMAIEAERRRQEEEARMEAERHRRCIEEARRHLAESIKASRAELVAAVEAWEFARRAQAFFEDINKRTRRLRAQERSTVALRTKMASEFLGGMDALERFRDWKAPVERLGAEDIELLDALEGADVEDEA